jgi:predicted nucleic acid-binding protein
MSDHNVDLDLAFETRILVDSDILIDVMRKVPVAAFVLQDAKKHAPLAISVITRLELVSGSANRENLLQVESILRRFEYFRRNISSC